MQCNKIIIFLAMILTATLAGAQTSALKNNLLSDITASPNLAVEIRSGGKTSIEIPVSLNLWDFDNKGKWKHYLLQPEFRLWSYETFSGHFFGFHGHYAYYNINGLPRPLFSAYMNTHRFQGWLAGAGISYGYRWNFSSRWAMEATVGAGYAYLSYDKYECGQCGKKQGEETKNYFGPTRTGINIIYNLGKVNKSGRRDQTPAYSPTVQPEHVPLVVPVAPELSVSFITPETETAQALRKTNKTRINFVKGKSEIIPSFGDNVTELQNIRELIDSVRNNLDATITGISITGYSSPEDTYAHNLTLSERRATAAKAYIQSIFDLPENLFSLNGKGEDWTMLDTLVSRSDMKDKFRILEIIRGIDIFAGREKKLMDISGGKPYLEMLTNMFPELRRSSQEIYYTIAPFTVEKGREALRDNPWSLSLNEMFLIANASAPGSAAFNELFEIAALIFPENDVVNLNAAAGALVRQDTTSAATHLSKINLQSRNAAYYNNTGVLYGLQGEYDKAVAEFERAKSLGNEQAAENLSNLLRFEEEMGKYIQINKTPNYISKENR